MGLTSGLVILSSLLSYSFISVISNVMLLLTLGGLSSKLYVHLMGLLKKPCKDPLVVLGSIDLSVKEDVVQELTETLRQNYNQGTVELKRLLLLENLFDSLKFVALLYLLTILGGMMSFLSFLTLCWVLAFILPTVYMQNRQQIDTYVEKAKQAWEEANSKVYSFMQTKQSNMETVDKTE